MTVTLGPKLSLLINSDIGETYVDQFRPFLRFVDAMVLGSVINSTTITPPASPNNGDAYLLINTPQDIWVGYQNAIAVWSTEITIDGTNNKEPGWEFHVPNDGWQIFDLSLNQYWYFIAGQWTNTLPESQIAGLTTALEGTEQVANKGTAGGYAGLDQHGWVPLAQIPPAAINHAYTVSSQSAMLALQANVGDLALRSDQQATWVLTALPATSLGNWAQLLAQSSPVQSVNNKVGYVEIASTDLTDASTIAKLASPAFTGVPTAPTPQFSDSSTTIATTQYVKNQGALYDTVGSAASAQAAAISASEAYSANASNITSGTIGAARLPLATSTTFGAIKPDNVSTTVTNGVLSAIASAPSGTVGGDLSGSLPNPTVAKVNGITPGDIIGHNAADFATAAQGAGALQKQENLSDLASVSTARLNLGLGSAAQSSTIAFDPAGAAQAAQAAAEASAANASNLTSGTVAASLLPVATTTTPGVVEPDGTTITVTSSGVISTVPPATAIGPLGGDLSGTLPNPTVATIGGVTPGNIISHNAADFDPAGAATTAANAAQSASISAAETFSANAANLASGTVPVARLPIATTTTLGVVEPDGSTITISSSGVLTATAPTTATGPAGGDLTGTYPNPTVAKINGQTPGNIVTHNVAEFDPAGAAAAAQAASLSKTAPVTIVTTTASTVGLIVRSAGLSSSATIVQSGSAFGSLSTSTLSVTFPNPVTAGNTLIAVGGFFNKNASNYCADSAGNSYSQPYIDSSGGYYSVNYCANVPAGSPTITMHSDGGDVQTLYCFEVSGIGAFQAATLATGSFGNGGGTMVIPNTTVSAATLAFTFGLVTNGTISHANTSLAVVPASSQPFTTQGVWAGPLPAGTYGDSIISSGTANQTFNVGLMVFFASTASGSSAYNTVALQEWEDANGNVLSSVSGQGQFVLATTSGVPTNTPAVGATAYDPSTGTLYGYKSSGWSAIGSLPSGGQGLVLATPASTSGVSSLRALVQTDIPTIEESQVQNLTSDLGQREVITNKGVPNGYASLDASGLIPATQLPSLAIDQTYVIGSQAAMLALSANIGDVAIRTDINQSFILQHEPASTLANWQQILTPTSPVQSVNGQVGNVSLASTNLTDSGLLARLSSPAFQGNPSTPTPATSDNSTTIANTAYVQAQAANYDAAGAAANAVAGSLQKSQNLSDLASVSTARTNLGLGSAALQPSTAFDPSGSAANALASAETFASNASNLSSGTVAASLLPVATTSMVGAVEPDGTSVTITTAGVISAVASGAAGGDLTGTYPNPTVKTVGGVTPGNIISHNAADFDAAGAASTAQTAAQTYAANASHLTSGTVAVARLPIATSSTLGVVEPDGSTITVNSSGVLTAIAGAPSGTVGGDLSGSLPNPTVVKINGVTPGNIISHNASDFDSAGQAVTAQQNAVTLSLQKSANLSDLSNVTTARSNLGLGSAATQPSSAFDAAGAAAAAIQTAEAFSSNASNLTSGTASTSVLPISTRTVTGSGSNATYSYSLGLVQPDGTSIVTGNLGVISAIAQVPQFTGDMTNNGLATTVQKINGQVPGNIVTHNVSEFDAAGSAAAAITTAEAYSSNASNLTWGTVAPARLPVATTSAVGAVEPDGTTITVTSSGVITAVAQAPSGTVGGDLSGSLPNPTVVKINGQTPGTSVYYNATQFDSAGAATTALTSAKAYSANASNLATGTIPASVMPALSGDVNSSAGSLSTTVVAVNNGSIPASATVVGTDNHSRFYSQTGTIANNTTGSAASLSTPLIVAQGGLGTATSPTTGQVLIAQGTSLYSPETISGDATIAAGGALTVTKTSGVAFAPSATSDTTNAANITSGTIPTARLPIATTSSLGVVEADNVTIQITSGGVITAVGAAPSGAANGDLSGTYPNPTVAKINGQTPGNIVTHNVAEFLTVANNLSDLNNASTARTNLGLGSAAVQSTTAFDSAGAAATAYTNAQTYSSNASNLSSGTVPVAQLPVATTSTLGVVKPDGSTISISSGKISSVTPSGSAAQVYATPATSSGSASLRSIAGTDLPLATTTAFGAVKPDGTTVTISSGVLSSVLTGAAGGDLSGNYPNPTVTKINGQTPGNIVTYNASQFDTIGAALAAQTAAEAYSANASNLTSGTVSSSLLPLATSTAVGAVKPDNSTITVNSSGVITAIGAAPSGTAGGDLSGSYPNPTVAKVGGVTPGNIISHNAADFDAAGSATTAANAAQAAAISAAETYSANASNLTSGTVAVSLIPTATTSTFGVVKPDGSSITVAGGVLSAVTSVSGSAGQVVATPAAASGTASLRQLVGSDLPVATTSAFGAVKPDGSSVTVSSGVITVPTATTSVTGIVKPDGSTITISGGVISAAATGGYSGSAGQVVATPATSTGTAGLRALVATDIPTLGYLLPANNLSDVASLATTRTNLGLGSAAFLSSSAFDAAGAAASAITTAEAYSSNASNLSSGTVPVAQLPVATTSAAGVVKPDGTTITISSGVISATSQISTPLTLGASSAAVIPLTVQGVTTVATPTFVQATRSNDGTYSKAFTSNVTAGNTIIVSSFVYASGGTITSMGQVTDTLGNSYVLVSSLLNGSTSEVMVWVASNIKGGACTVTWTVGSPLSGALFIHEYSGVGSFDVGTVTTGSGATTTATVVTTTANDLLFSFYANYTASTAYTAPTGFTLRNTPSSGYDGATADRTTTTAGSYSAVWTPPGTANNQWLTLIALKPGPPPQTGDLTDFKSPQGVVLSSVNAAGQVTGTVAATEMSVSGIATPVNAAFTTTTTGGWGNQTGNPVTSLISGNTYYYRVAAVNAVGITLPSTETSITISGSLPTITVNWNAVPGATGYRIYGRTTGAEQLVGTVNGQSVTSWVDYGFVVPSGALPTVNTTGNLAVNYATTLNTLAVSGASTLTGAATFAGITTHNAAVQVNSPLTVVGTASGVSGVLTATDISLVAMSTPTGVSVSFATTGGSLAASTTYSYRVAALDSVGTTLASTAGSATTGSSTSTNTATITWNTVAGAVTYYVYGRTAGAQLYIGATSAPTATFTDTGSITPTTALPTINTTGAVSGNYGNFTNFNVSGSATLPTIAGATTLSGAVTASTSVTVTGTTTSNELTVSGLAAPVNQGFATATTGGSLPASTTYYYRVAAYDSVGIGLLWAEVGTTTGSGVNTNTVTLTWSQVAGATGYKVYGRTRGAELLIATVVGGSTLTYTDTGSITPSGALPALTSGAVTANVGNISSLTVTGQATVSDLTLNQLSTPVNSTFTTATTGGSLAASTTYYYRVAATDGVGTTLASTETSLTTGSATGTNTITVNWTAVTGALYYNVYGRTTGTELLLATVPAPTLTFVDTGSITPAGTLATANTTGSLTVGGPAKINNTATITGVAGTPTYVQGAINSANTTLSTTFSSANTAGNAIAVFMFCGISATQTVPTDSLGNTYTLVSSTTNGTLCLFVYVALNILGGTNTVTVHNSSGAAHTIVLMHEYSNVALVSALDSQAVANATSANSGQTLTVSTTTINPSDLLLTTVFVVPGATPNEAAPSGYNLRTYINTGTGGCWAGAADQNVSSAGTYSASWITQGAAGNGYCLSLVALKALPASALTVSGSTTLNSTLAVTGATTLTGATSVGSTLAVTGATTVNGHLYNASGTPTVAAGAAAGTSPTVTLVSGSNDQRGIVSVTTGTSPSTTSGAVIATITFATAYTTTPVVVACPNGNPVADFGDWSVGYVSTTSFQILIGSKGTGLTASTSGYLWNYIVMG